MMRNIYFYSLGFVLIVFLSVTVASSQDVVVVSLQAGECSLTVESNERWHTLRLRAHHPEYKGCHVTRDDMVVALKEAFLKTDSPRLGGNYSSLSIGRMIDYPWLSQYLATTAYSDNGWDSKRGKPVAMDINKYVSQLLFRAEWLAQIEEPFTEGGYRIVGVTVEKVLVGGFSEVPFFQGEKFPGKVPYDAQVWFRLEKN